MEEENGRREGDNMEEESSRERGTGMEEGKSRREGTGMEDESSKKGETSMEDENSRKEGTSGEGAASMEREGNKKQSSVKEFFRKTGKSLAVAFSIYSIIPMPKFKWQSEDMDDHLVFFPWVGAAIGVLEWLWALIARAAGFGIPAFAAVTVAIPLLVTGGFHMDGYLDTMDAIHSYQPKEEKLRIMDDPHVGAFSVVWTLIWALLFYAGASELSWGRTFAAWCFSFFYARGLSGLAVVFLPPAKKEGMLQTFSNTDKKDKVRVALIVEVCICCVLMGAVGGIAGFVLVLGGGACYLVYRFWALRKFDGITGDMAGYFVCVCELVMTLLAGIMAA